MKPIYQALFAVLMAMMALTGCGDSSSPVIASQAKTAATITAIEAPVAVTTSTLTKVSEIRIGRTVYEYVFRVTFVNSGPQLVDVKALLTGVGPGTTIIDGAVSVGVLAAGAKSTPADTITLRHDRSFSFDVAALKWQVSGTPVVAPPVDVPGTDANNDGVRDDVALFIATKYGTDAATRAVAMQYARTLQKRLTAGPSQVSAILADTARVMTCMFDTLGAEASELMLYNIRNVQLNTEPRLAAFLTFQNNAGGSVIDMPPDTRAPRSTCE